MKKIILSAAFLMLTAISFAQVGVGTTSPTTSLDVVGAAGNTPGALAATDGVTIPRVTTDMTGSPAAGTTASQLVYSTHASSTGFYYWSGMAWLPLVPSGALNYTATAVSTYTVLATDDIIEYTGAAVANFVLPTNVPIGKTYYFASTANASISFAAIVTQTANTLSGGAGGVVVHMGSGRYLSSWQF